MLEYIELLNDYINVPAKLIVGIVGLLLFMQVIGEVLELFGKAAPGIMKLRKRFAEKKQREAELVKRLKEATKALKENKEAFDKLNSHYDDDNIEHRNIWMHHVDDGIATNAEDIHTIKEKLEKIYNISMKDHIEALRGIIIGFANRIADNGQLSHEEFRRAFNAHTDYEAFLKEHKLTNGQVDVAYRVITEEYAEKLRNHEFLEDIRGYHQDL